MRCIGRRTQCEGEYSEEGDDYQPSRVKARPRSFSLTTLMSCGGAGGSDGGLWRVGGWLGRWYVAEEGGHWKVEGGGVMIVIRFIEPFYKRWIHSPDSNREARQAGEGSPKHTSAMGPSRR